MTSNPGGATHTSSAAAGLTRTGLSGQAAEWRRLCRAFGQTVMTEFLVSGGAHNDEDVEVWEWGSSLEDESSGPGEPPQRP